jgi:hypothetical protein
VLLTLSSSLLDELLLLLELLELDELELELEAVESSCLPS